MAETLLNSCRTKELSNCWTASDDINMHFTRNTESHRKLSYVYLGYVENV